MEGNKNPANHLVPREFAERRKLDLNYIYRMLNTRRIAGAYKIGVQWFIPPDAEIQYKTGPRTSNPQPAEPA